jgi:hypothetical protein
MNLEQLKRIIDGTIGDLKGYENPSEIPVLISLSNGSVGARSSCEVSHVEIGFDWESGQFRIEPSMRLVKLGTSFTDIQTPRVEEFDGRKYYFCMRCESKISKDDKFCRYCSQKLK